jgi:hypothetical protein
MSSAGRTSATSGRSRHLTLPLPDGDAVAALPRLRMGSANGEREFGYALGPEIAEVELVNLRAA